MTVLTDLGEMTASGIAEAAGIGRSTATKMLAALSTEGRITRHEGGRDAGRRLPDRWSAATATTRDDTGRRATRPVAGDATRLGRGELAEQVRAYLVAHPGEHSPTAIASGLGGRSGGTVSNALGRLANRGQATLTQARPRRYAATGS